MRLDINLVHKIHKELLHIKYPIITCEFLRSLLLSENSEAHLVLKGIFSILKTVLEFKLQVTSTSTILNSVLHLKNLILFYTNDLS